jgi:hypothetical protein
MYSWSRYVYGFDEMPEVYNESVYEIFGGLKKKWPTLTTMAVLDWETFPSDLPLDIWVDEFLLRFMYFSARTADQIALRIY